MAGELRLDVDGKDVVFTDPGKARAAGRRWRRMAAELDGSDTPEVSIKQHELRARAKAAEDWARITEDRAIRANPPAAGPPSGERAAAAPAKADGPGRTPKTPAGDRAPSRGARRQAAAALAASGVRKGRRSASGARTRGRRASRRYEAAGGAPVATGAGEFAIFFFGGIVLLTLLEDVLTKRGSKGFAGATKTIAQLAHRVIAPVPIVSNGGP